jgi:hypothetical protein
MKRFTGHALQIILESSTQFKQWRGKIQTAGPGATSIYILLAVLSPTGIFVKLRNSLVSYSDLLQRLKVTHLAVCSSGHK